MNSNHRNECRPEFADAICYQYGLRKGKVLKVNTIVLGQLYGLVNRHGEDLVLQAWKIWLDDRDTSGYLFPVTFFGKEISAAIAIAETQGGGR